MPNAVKSSNNPVLKDSSLREQFLQLQGMDLLNEENDIRSLLSCPGIDYSEEKNELYSLILKYQLYAIVIRSQDLLESTIALIQSQHFVSVPLMIRGLLETSATSHEIDKRLPTSFFSEEKYEKFRDDFATGLLAGSRLKNVLDFKPPHIQSVLDAVDNLWKDNTPYHGRALYDVISEYCHPNFAAPSHFIIDDDNYNKGISGPSSEYKSILNFYLGVTRDSFDVIKTTTHSIYFYIEDFLMKSVERQE